MSLDYPGGSVVKNLPTNAGDRGSIPGPGGTRMPQSNEARVLQLLNLFSRAWEPKLLELVQPRAHALQQKKPLQWEARSLLLEKSPCSKEDPT